MNQNDGKWIEKAKAIVAVAWICLLCLLLLAVYLYNHSLFESKKNIPSDTVKREKQTLWKAPDTTQFENHSLAAQIRYGRNLIAHTSYYLGPNGTVAQLSNGMNCQNCHLDAGTKPFGNNYGSVASLYPRFRERSGSKEGIEKRVNDCLERSLNGKPLDSLSNEMRSIVAYINWVGHEVKVGAKAEGSGLWKINILERPADSLKGKFVYEDKCKVCHGENGEGLPRFNGKEYLYPPLWGTNSFNTAAGLYRISNMAGYVFANMPLGSSYDQPQLTEEQAWDVAAYIVSKARPKRIFTSDWPNIAAKPFDHPFGPYVDSFTESQHKLGPFKEILELRSAKK